MSTSAWGVDHGTEISKAMSERGKRHVGTNAALGALSPVASGVHAGVKGKQGKKLRAIGNSAGGAMLGGTVGGLAAAAATRSPMMSALGGTAGSAGGAALGSRRNVQRGYIKKAADSPFGKKYDGSKPYTKDDKDARAMAGWAAGGAAGAAANNAARRGVSAGNAFAAGKNVIGSKRSGLRMAGTALKHTRPGLKGALLPAAVGAVAGAAIGESQGNKRMQQRKTYLKAQKKG